MLLLRHLPLRDRDTQPTALAIGNFDGLHRGHQALIERVVAHEPDLRPGIMCFEPLPRTFFAPDRPVARLMTLRDRVRISRDLGIALIAQMRFDRLFSSLSPEAFARDVVADGVRASKVVVGDDFRFGQRAAGDVEALIRFGRRFGFEVETVPAVIDATSGERISSTGLRAALACGDLATAGRVLGRRYSISGRVLRGNQLGRTLGFPTVNLRVAEPPALSGICAVRVHGGGLADQPGVASLGQRPVVNGRDWLLEVHLFDLERDLYGSHLTVEFIEWLRPEQHFDDLAAMTEQMHHDAHAAKQALRASLDERQ